MFGMPKAMKVKCFIIFFAIFVVIAEASDDEDFEYFDCGSYLEISRVIVSGCDQAPCVFSPGENFTVDIYLSRVNKLELTEMTTEAYLWMFGTRWSLTISPKNPCTLWNCPLHEVDDLIFTAEVQMIDDVIRRPGYIELLIAYNAEGANIQALCVEFNITLQ